MAQNYLYPTYVSQGANISDIVGVLGSMAQFAGQTQQAQTAMQLGAMQQERADRLDTMKLILDSSRQAHQQRMDEQRLAQETMLNTVKIEQSTAQLESMRANHVFLQEQRKIRLADQVATQTLTPAMTKAVMALEASNDPFGGYAELQAIMENPLYAQATSLQPVVNSAIARLGQYKLMRTDGGPTTVSTALKAAGIDTAEEARNLQALLSTTDTKDTAKLAQVLVNSKVLTPEQAMDPTIMTTVQVLAGTSGKIIDPDTQVQLKQLRQENYARTMAEMQQAYEDYGRTAPPEEIMQEIQNHAADQYELGAQMLIFGTYRNDVSYTRPQMIGLGNVKDLVNNTVAAVGARDSAAQGMLDAQNLIQATTERAGLAPAEEFTAAGRRTPGMFDTLRRALTPGSQASVEDVRRMKQAQGALAYGAARPMGDRAPRQADSELVQFDYTGIGRFVQKHNTASRQDAVRVAGQDLMSALAPLNDARRVTVDDLNTYGKAVSDWNAVSVPYGATPISVVGYNEAHWRQIVRSLDRRGLLGDLGEDARKVIPSYRGATPTASGGVVPTLPVEGGAAAPGMSLMEQLSQAPKAAQANLDALGGPALTLPPLTE